MDVMDKCCIIPEVIDKTPPEKLKVVYEGDIAVELGNELTPKQTKNAPEVFWNADPDVFYTLCMTDPDAPSRINPDLREWHHWLVGNIPGNDVKSGETLSEYIGACPPADTGVHRYVFLVFQQQGKINFTVDRLTNTSTEKRANFSVRKFSFRNKLGAPIAGNFFKAQWDDYVPILQNQIGL